jgi:nucleotide-binding universal stress UspA family protein
LWRRGSGGSVLTVRAPRVLVAYDGSEHAGAALEAIACLEWPVSTRIRLLAVRAAHLRFLRPLVDEMLFFELEEDVERSAKYLSAVVPTGVAIESRVLRGAVVPTIVAEAEAFEADLVVLGSRNRGPLQATVLGSVGRELVAREQWPVLIARGDHLDRVLLAHDGTEAARTATRMLGAWPIFGRAAVRVFSVAQTPPTAATSQILTAAALEETDLIVLGSQAAHGMDRLLHGDLADDLVLHARCSLLVVPGSARVELGTREPALSV